MKVLVAIKRVVDANVKIRVKPDNSGVDLANVKMAINPFCEIAVEEAIRLKEKGIASEVLVVSVGDDRCQEQLRTALALGADRAVQIKTDVAVESLGVAKLLNAIVTKEECGLVILGKQSIDSDNNQTGQMLAAIGNMPQGTFASEIEFEEGEVRVTREVDGGLQKVSLALPAVITTDLRLNEPRFASLPNIMKAKRKPLEVLSPEGLNVDVTPRLTTVSVVSPSERQAGVIVSSVAELVEKLKTEAGVL
ncbi:electron transfer flavoprotein subunit beta/FixA family protein [Amphritea opalescens]|uniref:Electron transfer flavoprotein subunit beta n=1 Tax=Amphritea opalescens TaxID=2490544 RepID=A0A430KP00_9GAMM|nr:electron transfer flavoprotein subunit beta/FixA family protein [Amphritea opalescens]RTE65124.1 electron transfer flavoprotein subunit beta/FixA family protein [Amphritea opalescens]